MRDSKVCQDCIYFSKNKKDADVGWCAIVDSMEIPDSRPCSEPACPLYDRVETIVPNRIPE